MKNYRLIIIKFKYTNNFKCFWPIYFELDAFNNKEEIEIEILQKIKDALDSYLEIKEMEIILNKIATL